MTPRISIAAVLCAACTAAVFGQQTGPAVFRSAVEAVQMDVFVTDDRDKPISGLTPSDFEVYENGKPQAITMFAEVDSPLERRQPLPFDAESDVQSNVRPRRHAYMFMLYHDGLKTRHRVREFINEYFSDDDVAAIVVQSGLVTDGQDFTSNRRLLLAALDRAPGGGGKDMYGQDFLERMEVLARIPGGRKSVLWFFDRVIDGFNVIDYRGGVLALKDHYLHGAMSAATRANIRVYPIYAEGFVDGGVGASTEDFFQLDAPNTGPEARMNLRALAELTGGDVKISSSDFPPFFEQLVSETSSYYVLGFDSTIMRKQGRHIRLDVKTTRPGLKVRARTGYVEQLESIRTRMPPEPTRTPAETALANPLATPGLPMRVVATPYRKSGRTATVQLAIDLDPSALEFTERDGRFGMMLDLRHLATDARARIHPEYRHQGTLTLDAPAHAQAASSGIRVVSQLELANGRYQIRVASARGEANGSVVYDLEVPDFNDGPLTLSGVSIAAPSASRALNLRPDRSARSDARAVVCRERVCQAELVQARLVQWDDRSSGNTNLLRDVLPDPPTTAREFTAGDTLTFFAEIYDNNKHADTDPPYTLALTAGLYAAADSAPVRAVSEQRSSRAARRASGGHGFMLRLPLDGVPAGSYVLRLVALSERGASNAAIRSIPIRVQ